MIVTALFMGGSCFKSAQSNRQTSHDLLINKTSKKSDQAGTVKRGDRSKPLDKNEEVASTTREKPISEKTDDDMEQEVQVMLAHEERRVRMKAKPLLNRTASTAAMLDSDSKEFVAALKIQRCVRRMLAKAEAKAKQDWLVRILFTIDIVFF